MVVRRITQKVCKKKTLILITRRQVMKTFFAVIFAALMVCLMTSSPAQAGSDKNWYPVGSTVTTTTNGSAFQWSSHGTAYIFLDITTFSTTDTLTVKLQAQDPASQKFVDVPGAAFAAKTVAGTSMMAIGLGNTAVTNVAVNQLMPFTFRWVFTFAGPAGTITYSLAGSSPSNP